jgi:hypothetical protein
VSDGGGTPPTDVVDSAYGDRNCPYCGREQFWSPSRSAYCHRDNLLHCDEERLALWDMAESLKKGSTEQ